MGLALSECTWWQSCATILAQQIVITDFLSGPKYANLGHGGDFNTNRLAVSPDNLPLDYLAFAADILNQWIILQNLWTQFTVKEKPTTCK